MQQIWWIHTIIFTICKEEENIQCPFFQYQTLENVILVKETENVQCWFFEYPQKTLSI
jgi:hypothetical protein